MGRKTEKRTATATTTILLLALLLQPLPIEVAHRASAVEDEYSFSSLFFTVYADGMVDVECTVAVDPLLVNVSVSLPGRFYEDVLVVNEVDEPLDFSVLDGEVLVYSLGSWRLKFYYTTADLTSKEGRFWFLHVASPISFTVRLPADSTVVSLSEAPTSIWTSEGRYFLEMPAAEQEIGYIIGAIGSRDRAVTLIDEAEQAIEEAKDNGADVTQAETLLSRAKTALDEERYADAELLAADAKEKAAEARLPPAPTAEPSLDLYWITGATVMVGLAAVFALLALRKKPQPRAGEIEKVSRHVDASKILIGREHLRSEDREAVEFIASAGGEVFEAELREHFKLPKSTTWRMVKRLKREGLLEVKKVGGQNLIRLREK